MQAMPKKTVLITGAAMGIGRALAEEAAQRNYHLILVDIDALKLKEFSQELEAAHIPHEIMRCDVSDFSKVTQLLADILTRHATIDLIFNKLTSLTESLRLEPAHKKSCHR